MPDIRQKEKKSPQPKEISIPIADWNWMTVPGPHHPTNSKLRGDVSPMISLTKYGMIIADQVLRDMNISLICSSHITKVWNKGLSSDIEGISLGVSLSASP